MNNLLKLTLILSIGIHLFSCKKVTTTVKTATKEVITNENSKLIKVNNTYSISIPKFMLNSKKLNTEASLQYEYPSKEMYIIVIDEPKNNIISIYTDKGEYDDDISVSKNYRNIQLNANASKMNVINQSKPITLNSNGLDIEYVDVDATINGIEDPITYFYGFVEGESNVYMIMCWTSKSQKTKYMKDFKKSIESFQFL